MININLTIAASSLTAILCAQSVITAKDSFPFRDYTFTYAISYDLNNVTDNIRTGLKLFSDAYHRGIKPKIKKKGLRIFTDIIWTTAVKWSIMLWPHEFGHVARTQQAGGKFRFKRFAFPGIISSLELPPQADYEDKILSLSGGFEANALSAMQIQNDFYQKEVMYNDEYSMAFGHRILYSLYSYAFSFHNPNLAKTWINEGGDPVNFTKMTWMRANYNVFETDSSVNKKLIAYYHVSGIGSLLWNMIDYNFYLQSAAFFSNQTKLRKAFWLGEKNLKWFYGTFFNTSPLGAEFYLYNYLKYKSFISTIYFKYGYPMRNIGLGVLSPRINLNKEFSIDINAEIWEQQIYGLGFMACSRLSFIPTERLQISTFFGYKTQGYSIGKIMERGIIAHFCASYRWKN